MATQFPNEQANQIVARARRLLTGPAAEWAAIDSEAMTSAQIFRGWVVPLAAIGPLAHLVGSLLFGYSFLGFHYQPSLTMAVVTAVTSYAMALIGVWVVAMVTDALATRFGGTPSRIQALKVAAFSMTAAWLAGIFGLLPALSILGLLGLYSLYLLYLGLPKLMRVTEDKARRRRYTVAVIVVTAIVMIVAGAVTSAIGRQFAAPTGVVSDAGSLTGSLALPNGTKVDLGKLNDAAKRLQAAGDAAQQGKAAPAVPAATLQAMLPASIGGWTRTEVESQSGGAAGINGSHAEARYQSGADSMRLSVTDAGAIGALATLGGALSATSSKQTATGYEKAEMVDGRMVSEKWDNSTRTGSYGVMVASRFMVSAEGSAPSIDALKGAVGAVDLARLDSMAK